MDFNLDRLRSFIVVARAGNLSSAARELGTTQPNLGRQMTALEKEVRLTLFIRHSRGLGLTKHGEEFRLACQDIVGKISQIADIIREKDATPQGSLKVVSGAGMLDIILKNLPLFSKKFPDIHFDFSSVVNVYQLQIGDSDIAIMPDPISDPDFIQHHLYDMQMRIYASPSYLKEHGTPRNLEDLNSHKLVMYTGEHQETFNEQLKNDTTKNIFQPFITVRNGPAMRTALLSGSGIGCYGYDQELVEKNLLIDIFPDMPDQIMPYYYTYHCRLEGSPKVQVFYDFLKEEVVTAWERPDKTK
jgi:DNA-binding transcriptional LysR family regulator